MHTGWLESTARESDGSRRNNDMEDLMNQTSEGREGPRVLIRADMTRAPC
jgi:hypothetical protein